MKSNTKKVISLTLATMITLGSTIGFATGFNDVPNNHWAKEYIKDGNEKGFIKGYDNKFNPEQEISRMQTIALSVRILNLPVAEVNKAKDKHESMLLEQYIKSNDIWATGEIAVALSYGIIDTSDLNKLYSKNGAQSSVPREEVVAYLVKAMGLQSEVNSVGSSQLLDFKDAHAVNAELRPYIIVMRNIEVDGKKIITGDDSKNFKPKSPITRAEMSKLISMSYKYMEGNNKKDNITNITGTITNKRQESGKNYITVGVKDYVINSQSILKVSDKIVNYNDLNIGLEIDAEVINDNVNQIGIIKSLSSRDNIEKFTGVVYDFNDYAKNLTIEYKQNSITNRQVFSLDNKVEILLDKNKASLSDLRQNDEIKIEVINGKIIKIEAESKTRDIKGILKEINIRDNYIAVEDKEGDKERYDLDKDVTVRRDGRRVDLERLRKGDKVEIHVEDRVVLEIEAEIVKTKLEGTIKRKSVSYDKNEITILNNKTNKEETYLIPSDANIELDGKRTKLDKLELGYYVKINLEGEEIVDIEGQATVLSDKHLGIITYANSRSYIEMRLENGKAVEVILDDADIRDDRGEILSYRSLGKGDTIIVTGELIQDEIIAEKIIKLIK